MKFTSVLFIFLFCSCLDDMATLQHMSFSLRSLMTFTRPVNSEFASLAVGFVLVEISLCNQTFINCTALLMSLMACARAR